MLKTLSSLSILLFLVILCLTIGQSSIFFMNAENIHWYVSLQKPIWTAPNFVFPIARSVFYVLMALSVWLIWRTRDTRMRTAAFFCWGIQLLLNVLWGPLFFGQQSIGFGIAISVLLWIFVLATTMIFFRSSKFAALLMGIYFVWVSYMGALIFAIWQMNV